MSIHVEILRGDTPGNSIKITSDCQTVQELKDVLIECRDYIPVKRFFGIF